MSCLYHYCSNMKCFNILGTHSLRMSDIRKSNYYNELCMFYPDIFDAVLKEYDKNPFPFFFKNESDKNAIIALIYESQDIWEHRFAEGEFTNFVVCFSEECNLLSQWRGYADNGQGCNIGLSIDQLKAYCTSMKGAFRLEKVRYIDEKKRIDILQEESQEILDVLKGLRVWIVENMTKNDSDPDTEGLIGFNFDGMLESIFIDSLIYKADYFSEEKEWRLFFSNHTYKNPDWVCGDSKKLLGPKGFSQTIDILRNKIHYQITERDIVPYFILEFSSFISNPVSELWIGPKSLIMKEDIELYMRMNGYEKVQIKFSNISYCG